MTFGKGDKTRVQHMLDAPRVKDPPPGWSTWYLALVEPKGAHTVRHELGHALTTDEIFRRWKRLPYSREWHARLSMLVTRAYAYDWEHGAIAECFAWFTSHGYISGSLLEDIVSILEDMVAVDRLDDLVLAMKPQQPPPGWKLVLSFDPDDPASLGEQQPDNLIDQTTADLIVVPESDPRPAALFSDLADRG